MGTPTASFWLRNVESQESRANLEGSRVETITLLPEVSGVSTGFGRREVMQTVWNSPENVPVCCYGQCCDWGILLVFLQVSDFLKPKIKIER